MHTARQLKKSVFEAQIEGEKVPIDDLFPGWGPLDRFGIVVHEPYGSIGASYLIEAATAMFYDAGNGRRDTPVYPDIFVFHVGGRYGDHATFDFFPSRKEVFVENDPAAVLSAINDRGITFLAVPDREPDVVQHEWKEPQQTYDRLGGAFAYSATGRTENADVAIEARLPVAEYSVTATLNPGDSNHEQKEIAKALAGRMEITNDVKLVFPEPRDGEVDADTRQRLLALRQGLKDHRFPRETYRRISSADAITMLHIGPAPAFVENPDFEENPYANVD